MSMRRQWEDYYIDYRGLKKLIKRAVERAAAKARDSQEGGEGLAAAGALAQALLPRDSLGGSVVSVPALPSRCAERLGGGRVCVTQGAFFEAWHAAPVPENRSPHARARNHGRVSVGSHRPKHG